MPEETPKSCTYPDCRQPVHTPHDQEHCIFHAPKEKKGEADGKFEELILRKIRGGDYNFKGYVFHIAVNFRGQSFGDNTSFEGARFEGKQRKRDDDGRMYDLCVDFRKATFHGRVSFKGAKFSGGSVLFRNSNFAPGRPDFTGAVFSSPETDFRSAQFQDGACFRETRFASRVTLLEDVIFGGSDVVFTKATFCGRVSFYRTEFSSRVNFARSVFRGELVRFARTRFAGDRTDFSRAIFARGNVTFVQTDFSTYVTFMGNEIRANARLGFIDVVFGNQAVFQFSSPTLAPTSSATACIVFRRVRFNPFAALFEGFHFTYGESREEVLHVPAVIFRYCQLQDAYFAGNYMSVFSFYKSSFDAARFISTRWKKISDRVLGKRYWRKNIIFEEELFSYLQENVASEVERVRLSRVYEIGDLTDYEEVGSLYRRMKTALDRTKDYQEAGWFYFNEFEMKRLALQEQLKKRRWVRRLFSRLSLYNLYKALAGYGEKPLWSFFWLWILTALFAGLHLLSGLHAPVGKYINYDISFSLQGAKNHISPGFLCELLKHYGQSLLFTLYRIIPVSYLPYQRSEFYPLGFDGMVVSFLNTAVLLLMVVFIGIGLKRHFRRF